MGARHGCTEAQQALDRIVQLFTRLAEGSKVEKNLPCILKALVSRLLSTYDDQDVQAISLALSIFTNAKDCDGGDKLSVVRTDAENVNCAPTAGTNNKRSLETDSTVILEAVASWGRPHLKRFRSDASWPRVQPAAFAAMIGGDVANDLDKEVEAAVASWAKSTELGYILQALLKLGPGMDANVFDILIRAASAKATSLEEDNSVLGGN